jgi:hypothetical protein
MTEPRILTKDDFLHLEQMARRRRHEAQTRRETLPPDTPARLQAHRQARAESALASTWVRRAYPGLVPLLPR